MKKQDKKILILNGIISEHEKFFQTKGRLEIKILKLQNQVENDKYNQILTAFRNYKEKILNVFARTNRVFIRINTTPSTLKNLSIDSKKEELTKIYNHYEKYYNMGNLNIYKQIKSLKLILTEFELKNMLECINSYKDYIINILSKTDKIGIFSNENTDFELYYYDVFKIPE